MRFGVAGVGRIGVLHAENLAAVVGADSVLIADADVARATTVAEKLGAVAVPHVDALFAAGLDGLVVAVPTDGHAELIVRAVDAGVPVFCEKPVAPDLAGTAAVLERLRRSEVPVQIGFQRRFDAGYVAARAAVASGELGRLHTVLGFTLDPSPPPASYIPGSGGIFRDCAVHDLDILRWVTGQEIVEVYATGSNLGADYIREAGDVDAAAVSLILADGTLAQLSASRYNRAGYDVRMELRGHDDSIVVGLDPRTPLRSVELRHGTGRSPLPWPGDRTIDTAVEPTAVPGEAAYPGFLDRFRDAYAAEITAFARLVVDGGPSPCTVSDALAAFVLAEACEESRRQHRPVAVGEVK